VRPVKCGEWWLLELDESLTPQEVVVAEAGGYSAAEVSVGAIKPSPTRLGIAWVRCPVGAMHKSTTAKKLRVGWISVRVGALGARPLSATVALRRDALEPSAQAMRRMAAGAVLLAARWATGRVTVRPKFTDARSARTLAGSQTRQQEVLPA
jgi:hypothetical protein